jgi:hypothetical protein
MGEETADLEDSARSSDLQSVRNRVVVNCNYKCKSPINPVINPNTRSHSHYLDRENILRFSMLVTWIVSIFSSKRFGFCFRCIIQSISGV